MTRDSSEQLQDAARALSHPQSLFITAGPGLSDTADHELEDSRTPSARRPHLGRSPEDLFSATGFRLEPDAAWGYWEWRRRLIYRSPPSPAFAALESLRRRAQTAFLQSTLTDGLHRLTGWPIDRLYEERGSIWRLQCCGQFFEDLRVPMLELSEARLQTSDRPRCPRCEGVPRPHMQLFADLEFLDDEAAVERRDQALCSEPDVALMVGECDLRPDHLELALALRVRFGTLLIAIQPDPGSRAALLADIAIPLEPREALTRLRRIIRRGSRRGSGRSSRSILL